MKTTKKVHFENIPNKKIKDSDSLIPIATSLDDHEETIALISARELLKDEGKGEVESNDASHYRYKFCGFITAIEHRKSSWNALIWRC